MLGEPTTTERGWTCSAGYDFTAECFASLAISKNCSGSFEVKINLYSPDSVIDVLSFIEEKAFEERKRKIEERKKK